MSTMEPAASVGPLIRSWRTARGKSQLTLATEAGISARHLSFVETGRSSPSREMVLMLAEHLDVPLRERNALLTAAGYAAVYRETPFDAPQMSEMRESLSRILAANEPNPALVVNRRYDILLANDAAVALLSFFAPDWRGKNNVALMLLAPDGLRPALRNWADVAGIIVHRLRSELSALHLRDRADEEMLERANEAQSELRQLTTTSLHPSSILLPVQLVREALHLDLFTTITTLGTPLDITLQELRIESFFPVDATARSALEVVMRAEAD
jgi:transcriptional regulator with XRE-family HTH domain